MEAMFNTGTDLFDVKLRGTFGCFATRQSHPAYYFLTTIPIRRLKSSLQVAADALPIDKITFSQMIQRDVNTKHVDEIKDYVAEGKGRSVFFPPLLASIISKDLKGELQESFDKGPEGKHEGPNLLSITWGGNLFRLKLYGGQEQNDKLSRMQGFGPDFYYYDYGAHLELNPNRSSLVVLDGQHRYKALSSLYDAENYRPEVEGIEVPICIVFSPFAIGSERSGLKDLRDIFITVNNEAKQVSGHFSELLHDRSLATLAVRELAELWKNDQSKGYSKLHHLEWNIYDTRKAGQLNRSYSITSVTIIAEALRSYLFTARSSSSVLHLTEIQEELLKLDSDFDIDSVEDKVDEPAVLRLMKPQVLEHVAKPLSILLSTLEPSQRVITKMTEKMKWLVAAKKEGDHPELSLLHDRFAKHQIPSDAETIAPDDVYLAYKNNFAEIDKEKTVAISRSRLAVFQQALIRVWSVLCRELINEEVLPIEAATMVVAALNKAVVPDGMRYLDNGVYTSRMLWVGESPNFKSDRAKRCWGDLILGAFATKKAKDAALDALEAHRGVKLDPNIRTSIARVLSNVARQRVADYLEELQNQLFKFYKTSFGEVIQDEAEIDELRRLQFSAKDDDKKKFKDAINKIVALRHKEATVKLLAELSLKDLQPV